MITHPKTDLENDKIWQDAYIFVSDNRRLFFASDDMPELPDFYDAVDNLADMAKTFIILKALTEK